MTNTEWVSPTTTPGAIEVDYLGVPVDVNTTLINFVGGGVVVTPISPGNVQVSIGANSLAIGDAIVGASPYSVLVTDSSSDLSEVTPSADGFLFWNNTTHTYSFAPSTSSIAIGDPIVSAQPFWILYPDTSGNLSQDNGFYRDPTNNFLTVIQQTDGLNQQGSIIGTNGAYVIESINILSNDVARISVSNAFIRNYYSLANGDTGIVQISGTAVASRWSDGSTNLNSTNVLDSSGSLTTASNIATGFSSTANITSNQWTLKNDNGLGTIAEVYGTVFGVTNLWTDGTVQSILSAGSTNVHALYDDGAGATSQTFWTPSSFNTNYTDSVGYFAQMYGASGQTYHLYQTPYQLVYTNPTGLFTSGETVTGGSSGATAEVVFDQGVTYMVVGNASGPFQAGETIAGDQSFNTADLSPYQSQLGIFEALFGISQDNTPTGSRYAVFRNDTTLLIDRFELKHVNEARFITPIVTANDGSGGGRFDARLGFDINGTTTIRYDATPANLKIGANTGPNVTANGGTHYTGIGHAVTNAATSINDVTALGWNAGQSLSTGDNVTLLGSTTDVSAGTDNNCIAIGFGSETTTNHFVAGSNVSPITNIYFGNGIENAAPSNFALQGTNGLGTDVGGGNIFINGGQGTGSGQGGYLYLQTAKRGSTGTSPNNLNTIAVVNEDQFVTTAGRAINRVSVGDANHNIVLTDELISFTSVRTATRNAILPSAASAGVGATYSIKDAIGDATTHNIAIIPDGADTVDHDASGYLLNLDFQSVTLVSDGNANWEII